LVSLRKGPHFVLRAHDRNRFGRRRRRSPPFATLRRGRHTAGTHLALLREQYDWKVMTKMRVVQIPRAGGPFELVERDVPEPQRGWVRIKVDACGIV
jgi:hypothetical protein